MTKLQIKSDRITFFGGIYLVNRLFDQFSLGKVINDTLGLRSTAYNGYQWDEIVKSLFDIYLCGGDHIEDFAGQWKFSGDKHKSLQVDTERTFHQRYPLVML